VAVVLKKYRLELT